MQIEPGQRFFLRLLDHSGSSWVFNLVCIKDPLFRFREDLRPFQVERSRTHEMLMEKSKSLVFFGQLHVS